MTDTPAPLDPVIERVTYADYSTDKPLRYWPVTYRLANVEQGAVWLMGDPVDTNGQIIGDPVYVRLEDVIERRRVTNEVHRIARWLNVRASDFALATAKGAQA